MPTYAIGDIQGCLAPLKALLDKIQFDVEQDTLWFTGDLINRGPDSLDTLRFISSLPTRTVCVLGNHDLALLAINAGVVQADPKDTIDEILSAPDKEALLSWLKTKPLLHHDPKSGFVLTHAGVYPHWTLEEAKVYAKEVEEILQGAQSYTFLENMYGDSPNQWDPSLSGFERLRFITNAFTRMRFCTKDGRLDLKTKDSPVQHPDLFPWFNVPDRPCQDTPLIFGHWAALNANTTTPNLHPLDTGCVWGNCLSAFCLETGKTIQVTC